ncbi:MAG: nucleotide exchange factor GrpE [Patescibacteria group bacterium]|nr:nucleotide exchange factor GrpE [Patescibacteria group bacterium]
MDKKKKNEKNKDKNSRKETLRAGGSTEPKANWEDVAKRALADLDNYKKQQEKQRDELTQFMSAVLLTKFLSVNDDMGRLLDSVKSHDLDPEKIPEEVMTCQMGVIKGMENIIKKMDEVFKAEGMERVSAKPGDKFDPNVMEAISHEEHEEYKEDTVIDQFESGLCFKDKIIKPVKVRVGK